MTHSYKQTKNPIKTTTKKHTKQQQNAFKGLFIRNKNLHCIRISI